MKSFLLKNNCPVIKWGNLPDGIFYEGVIPEGFDLAVSPSDNYIILDVDVKNNKNGYEYIPHLIQIELDKSFYYNTKSGGRHYWLNYTSNKELLNRATQYGLDLRVAKGKYAKGYVKYPHSKDIRECIHLINTTSEFMNLWLEKLFS